MFKKIIWYIGDFILRNLEFIPIYFALQYWSDTGNSWGYLATILLIGICSTISLKYNLDKFKKENEKNKDK